MASSMPSEVLEKFRKQREETKAPSGEELSGREETRKRAKAKARKVKASMAK